MLYLATDIGPQLVQTFGVETFRETPELLVAPLPVDAGRYLESCKAESAESELFGQNHFFSLRQKFVTLANSRESYGNIFTDYNDAFGNWLRQNRKF